MIEIKVGEAGGQSTTILPETRPTVAQALEMAGISLNGRSIRVNGVAKSANDLLNDGDAVIVQNKKYSGGC